MTDPDILNLLPAIDEQLSSPDTPFVMSTFERLTADHAIASDEARYMIAFCLADEIERLGHTGTAFNLERYQTLLSLLPTLPEG